MDSQFGSPPRSARHGHRSSRHQAWVEGGTVPAAEERDRSRNTSGRSASMQPNTSSYQTYPEQQPFINDNYRRPANKPVKALPESNRQAVMSALKGLQAKIRQLEHERGQAEANLRSLAVETNRYHDIVHQHAPDIGTHDHTLNTSQANLSVQTQEVEGQLEAAENRCQLLERQLDYMRQMVHNSEQTKAEAVQRSLAAEQQRSEQEHRGLKMQIDKLNELERDHLRLTATQTMAEASSKFQNKIRELHDKLQEERHHRRVLQERASDLESQTESGRILQQSYDTNNNRMKRPVKKKKKKTTKQTSSPAWGTSAKPQEHYRLNLAEIPFVAGQSTGESHSVPANVQKVLSMMKSHNPKLCSPGNSRKSTRYHSTGSSSGVSSGPATQSADLQDLLLQLQDEFGHMSIEHQELSRQINEAHNDQLREDLERELDHLVMRMEVKGDQITKVRRHQTMTEGKKKKKSPVARSRPQSASARVPVNGVVEVRTTIKSQSDGMSSRYVQPGSSFQAKNFLKNLKKIQTTLGKDDLSWDC